MPYVLVVDEDQESRQFLCRMIEQVGVRVECVSTGKEAIALIENEAPVMVFLHLLTLTGDGLDLLSVLRSRETTKAIPIAMVSSFSIDEQNLLAAPEVRSLIQQEGMTVSDLVDLLQPKQQKMTRQAVLN